MGADREQEWREVGEEDEGELVWGRGGVVVGGETVVAS